MKKSECEEHIKQLEEKIRKLELEIARLQGENSILRQVNSIPRRPEIIHEIRHDPFPRRHPDTSPWPHGFKIQSPTDTKHLALQMN